MPQLDIYHQNVSHNPQVRLPRQADSLTKSPLGVRESLPNSSHRPSLTCVTPWCDLPLTGVRCVRGYDASVSKE
jgi:hypothetical protein